MTKLSEYGERLERSLFFERGVLDKSQPVTLGRSPLVSEVDSMVGVHNAFNPLNLQLQA